MTRRVTAIVVTPIGTPSIDGLNFLARYLRGRLAAEKRPEIKLCPKCGVPYGDPAANEVPAAKAA